MWLGAKTDQLIMSKLVPRSYEFNHILRKGGKRGFGIGIIHSSGQVVTMNNLKMFKPLLHVENPFFFLQ